jgi:hypothetical protein
MALRSVNINTTHVSSDLSLSKEKAERSELKLGGITLSTTCKCIPSNPNSYEYFSGFQLLDKNIRKQINPKPSKDMFNKGKGTYMIETFGCNS